MSNTPTYVSEYDAILVTQARRRVEGYEQGLPLPETVERCFLFI